VKNKLLHQVHWWFVFLTLFVFGLRLIPILVGSFAFMYDHARDSLAIWEMAALGKPALLGAQTSIPGLYYGPAWYYMALPLNLLLSFHPFASVLTTILLAAAAVILATRSFDKITTVLFASSMGLVAAQQSGWSPYLTSITSIFILVFAQKLVKSSGRQHFLFSIALVATLSLSFHFQPAFAIVQLPLVLFALRAEFCKFSLQELGALLLVFVVPFFPQILFEIRHDFHQVSQLWLFISQYGAESARVGQNTTGFARVFEIGRYVLDSGASALPLQVPLAGFVVSGLSGWQYWKSRKVKIKDVLLSLSWLLVIGSFFLYLILPAKSYYFVGLTPYWIYILATVVRKIRVVEQRFVLAVIGVAAVTQLGLNMRGSQTLLMTRNAYDSKQAVIEKLVELASDELFVVYHYTPELYDYTYQVLHFREMKKNTKYLPAELSYEPNKTLYLDEYSTNEWAPSVSREENSRTFLVVEADERTELFQAWWERVAAGFTVIETYTINPEISIYEIAQ